MKIRTKTSTTLNPKTLTGIENMNETMKENLLNQVETIEKRARREALREAADILFDKVKQINNILDSEEAQNIFYNSPVRKFDRMLTLRESLRSKNYMLLELSGQIGERAYNQ